VTRVMTCAASSMAQLRAARTRTALRRTTPEPARPAAASAAQKSEPSAPQARFLT
jgi:hypothetical protein